jgi:hypothetical protein
VSEKVVYSGHFVQNRDELLQQLPPAISEDGSAIHAHHVTKEFQPAGGLDGVEVGRERTLQITGHVVAEGIHAAIIQEQEGDPLTANKHAHITIATAPGVAPAKSNEVVAKAISDGTVVPIEPPITVHTVEGYYDGKQIHI